MALAKLTATGDVHVTNAWARPDVYANWLDLLRPQDYQTIVDAMNHEIDDRNVVRAQYFGGE